MPSTLLQSIEPDKALLFLPLESQYDALLDGVNLVTGDPYDPASWTAENAAVLTRQVGAYLGGDALRVGYNAVANPAALRAILTVNKRYRLSAALRNGGGTSAEMLAGTASVGLCTAATFGVLTGDVTCAGNTNLRLRANTAAGGTYADFAAISAYELRRATKNIGLTSGAPAWAQMGDGYTSSTIPTLLPAQASARYPAGAYFNGQRIEVASTGPSDPLSFSGSASFTVCCLYVSQSITNTQNVIVRYTATTNGWGIIRGNSGIQAVAYGTGSVTATAPYPTGRWASVVAVFSGLNRTVRLYINGIQEGNVGSYPNAGIVAIDTSAGIGGKTGVGNNMVGSLQFPAVYPFAFGDAQANAWHRMAQGWRRLP